MQKRCFGIVKALFTVGNHSGDAQGDAGVTWIQRIHSVFWSIYSDQLAKSKDFLYKSSQIMGFPDIFAMWHFFGENRMLGTAGLIREVHIETTIGERFSRKINNFCKRNHSGSQKKCSLKHHSDTDWPEFHEIQHYINFGEILGNFVDLRYVTLFQWKNEW